MKSAIGSLAVLFAVSMSLSAFEENPLANPSFEENSQLATGWVDFSNINGTVGAPAMTGAQEGKFAIELDLDNGVSEVRQSFPANAGEEYELRGWMQTEDQLPGGPAFGLYKIVFQDECGVDLQVTSASLGQIVTEFPGIESLPFCNDQTPPNTWIESAARGIAPAGTVRVVFLALNVDFVAGDDPIWFDNIQGFNTADGTNLLANPGFETGDTTGWLGGGGGPVIGAPAAKAQDGTLAATIKSPGGVGIASQSFPIMPGDEVSLSGFLLTEIDNVPGGSFGLYKIEFKDADGNVLQVPAENVTDGQPSDPGNPGIDSLPFVDGNSPVGIWFESSAAGIAPENSAEVTFLALNVDFGGGNNAIWIDNIQAKIPDACAGTLTGDVNLDGAVNLLDVGPFVELLNEGGFQCEADANGDGAVDLLDVASFVALLGG